MLTSNVVGITAGIHLKKNAAAMSFKIHKIYCGLIKFQRTETRFIQVQ